MLLGRALGEKFLLRSQEISLANLVQEILAWPDILLVDLRETKVQLDDERLRFLEEVSRIAAHPPIVVLTDEDHDGITLQAIERGAIDSVKHPPNIPELRLILQRAHRFYRAEQELRELRNAENRNGKLHDLIGTSPAMQELFNLARRIAPADVNVLITGETGTGKELMARAIHRSGARSSGVMVAFSCANLPETLVEDELFGHERGAFTGAHMCRQGRLESANHGSLFLDEVGDLPIGLQPKLLRVLQERKFERLGSNRSIDIDVRLISATNHDLAELVKQGKFREDLYYRLNVVELHLPSLRDRRDDISLLAYHFLRKYAQVFQRNLPRLSAAALTTLERYNWPGNVRQLENVVQRAVVLSEGHTLETHHLPPSIEGSGPQAAGERDGWQKAEPASYEDQLRKFKRDLLLRTLQENGWKKSESARALGIARGYLHRLINQLEIREQHEGAIDRQMGDVLGTVM